MIEKYKEDMPDEDFAEEAATRRVEKTFIVGSIILETEFLKC